MKVISLMLRDIFCGDSSTMDWERMGVISLERCGLCLYGVFPKKRLVKLVTLLRRLGVLGFDLAARLHDRCVEVMRRLSRRRWNWLSC